MQQRLDREREEAEQEAQILRDYETLMAKRAGKNPAAGAAASTNASAAASTATLDSGTANTAGGHAAGSSSTATDQVSSTAPSTPEEPADASTAAQAALSKEQQAEQEAQQVELEELRKMKAEYEKLKSLQLAQAGMISETHRSPTDAGHNKENAGGKANHSAGKNANTNMSSSLKKVDPFQLDSLFGKHSNSTAAPASGGYGGSGTPVRRGKGGKQGQGSETKVLQLSDFKGKVDDLLSFGEFKAGPTSGQGAMGLGIGGVNGGIKPVAVPQEIDSFIQKQENKKKEIGAKKKRNRNLLAMLEADAGY